MEESFKLRVERLFGSHLFETVPKSSFPETSWSVIDGEVEKKEWNRERGEPHPDREETPCASSFDHDCFSTRDRRSFRNLRKQQVEYDLEPDDGDEEEEEDAGDDSEKEERDIRASVGLDSTLDHEDEEDEFDKVAECRENDGERLYMRDIKDHGPFMNIHSIVPDLLEDQSEESHHFRKDPRADHLAASVRLREDKEAIGNSHSVPTCYDHMSSVSSQVKITESDVNVKPILKRKVNQIDSRPKKHVRFDPGCKEDNDEFDKCQYPATTTQPMETTGAEASSLSPADSPAVPDYVRNPSKYVCYTLDTSDGDDERSNLSAFEDFRNMVKKSNPEKFQFQPEYAVELPKSLTFMPRKKTNDAMTTEFATGVNHGDSGNKESKQSVIRSVAIAAVVAQENEACAMEEDDIEASVLVKPDGPQKTDRQYRSKAPSDDSVP